MATTKAAPYVFSAAEHSHLVPYLAALHGMCITHDHMIDVFLPPLNHEKLLAWWKERIAESGSGRRVILLLLDESEPGSRAKGVELVGAVMLALPSSETSPFRAQAETLLISPKYRRRGGARVLVAALHAEAAQRGKTLVIAEAEAGSPGEKVLEKLGYIPAGGVPNYAISPADHGKKDQSILYKELSPS